MNKRAFALAALIAVSALPAAASTMSSASTMSPVVVMPSQIKWASNAQLPPGGKMAVLAGNPEKAGWYVIRIMLPAGAKFPAHFHGGAEYVTVISGTFLAGLGDKMDTAKMLTLPAGSFVMMPAGVHHWAMAKDNVVLELSGAGPMTTNEVKGGAM